MLCQVGNDWAVGGECLFFVRKRGMEYEAIHQKLPMEPHVCGSGYFQGEEHSGDDGGDDSETDSADRTGDTPQTGEIV